MIALLAVLASLEARGAEPKAWWLESQPCPTGAQLYVTDTSTFCARLDGTRDGRSTSTTLPLAGRPGGERRDAWWDKGVRDGLETVWSAEGKTLSEFRWDRGALVNATSYHKSGALEASASWTRAGSRDGQWELRAEDGNSMVSMRFVNGRAQGSVSIRFPDTVLEGTADAKGLISAHVEYKFFDPPVVCEYRRDLPGGPCGDPDAIVDMILKHVVDLVSRDLGVPL